MHQKNIFKVTSVTPQTIWSLEEVKNYLRIEADYDNTLITSLIEAAIIAAENFTKLAIISRMIELTGNILNQPQLQLKYAPVQSLEKVTIKIREETWQLQDQQYYVDKATAIFCLNEPLEYQEIVVNYMSGFDAQDIPPAIKHGILLHVAEMYDRESSNNMAMSLEIKNLYLPYRQLRI